MCTRGDKYQKNVKYFISCYIWDSAFNAERILKRALKTTFNPSARNKVNKLKYFCGHYIFLSWSVNNTKR